MRALRSKNVPLWLYVFVIYLGITQILSFFRSTFIFNSFEITNYLLLVDMVLCVFFSVRHIKSAEGYFHYPVLLLLIFLLFSAVVGLFGNGISRDYLTELLVTANALLLLQALSSSKPLEVSDLLWIADAIFYAYVIFVIMVFLAPFVGIHVYTAGLNTISSMIPFVIYLLLRKKVKFLLSALIIIYCGKRGVLLSAAVVMVTYFVWSKPTVRVSNLLGLLSICLCVVFLLWSTSSIENVSRFYPSGQFNKIAVRIHRINPFADDQNKLGTESSRTDEVQAVATALSEDPLRAATGMGLGFVYYVDGAAKHNTHISPVIIAARYGPTFALLFYGLIVYTLLKSYRLSKRGELGVVNSALFFYALASFVSSFTEFSIFNDILFIFSIGSLYGSIMKLRFAHVPKPFPFQISKRHRLRVSS